MPQATCNATTRAGKPCRAPAVSNGRCAMHAPELAERMQAGRAMGGAARSNANRAARAMPDDLKAVGTMLLQAMKDVRAGTLDTKIATALASLANAYKNIYEVGTIDQKLAAIDERLKAAEQADKGSAA